MSINSYAQNFEDVMLWRALGHVKNGFYIDVGAQDPLIDSVSLAFHEHGWKGIHVEPTPHYAELLRQQRPGDTVIQAAIGIGRSKLKFFEIPKTGISTGDPVIAQQHRERGFDVREISVSSMPLSAVFKSCDATDIHWLKIDVEGFEKQVLSSWGKSTVRPWIVIVESTLPLTQIETYEDWEPLLLSYGYTVAYFDGLNRYYISNAHEELRAAFYSPPNVFDAFTLNGTASATFHHLIDARYNEKIKQLVAQSELQAQNNAVEVRRLNHKWVEQEQALQVKMATREQQLINEITSYREKIALIQSNAAQREKALSSLSQQTLDKARSESQAHLKELIERERAFNIQLSTVQAESQKITVEQARTHAEGEHRLRGDIAQLQVTLSQVRENAAERERFLLEQSQQALEKIRSESQVQQQQFIDQERALMAKLVATQGDAQAAAEEQGRVHLERENILRGEITQLQAILNEVKDNAAERERFVFDQSQQALEKIRSESQVQQQQFIERERALIAQLVQVQEEAKAAAEDQRIVYVEREHLLQDEFAQLQTTLNQVKDNAAERERFLFDQSQQAQEKIRSESQAQLTQAQSDAKAAAGELENIFVAREQVLQGELAELREAINRAKDAALHREIEHQNHLESHHQSLQSAEQRWAQQEQVLEMKLEQLKTEHHAQQLHAQQLDFKLNAQLQENERITQTFAAFEAQLKLEIQQGNESNLNLRHLLATEQRRLNATHATLSWRMTKPLRTLAAFIAPSKVESEIQLEIAPSTVTLETPLQVAIPNEAKAVETNVPPQVQHKPAEVYMQSTNPPATITCTTINQLLALQGESFIRAAYQSLLSREPDPEGMSYYLGRLKAGYSKIQMVAQLRLSKEGSVSSVNLRGLDTMIKSYQRGQYPVIGWLIRLVEGTEGNQPAERKLRAIEYQIHLMREETGRRFNQVDSALHDLRQLVKRQGNEINPINGESAHNDQAFAEIEPEGLKNLSEQARNVYFQLIAAAARHVAKGA